MTRARAGAAACTLALLCGCGGSHRSPPAPPAPPAATGTPAARTAGDRPPSRRVRLQALLARRAQALETGDADAYAATATGAQRARDRRTVRRAAGVRLRDLALDLRDARVRGRRATLRIGMAWGVRGVRGTIVGERRLRARRTRAGWRIAAVAGTRGRAPWELARYREHRLGHFAVLAPAGLPIAADGLPRALADGYARLRGALPHAPLHARYLVVVASDASVARRLTQGIHGVEGLAAISDTAVREAGAARRVTDVLSQRLVVVWPAFAALGWDERRRVVAHELTHAVLASTTSGRTPSWLVEGIALYVSGDRRDAQVSAALDDPARAQAAGAGLSLRRLSAPAAIAHLSGTEQTAAYAYAAAAAFAIADRHGRRALVRLYDAFNDDALHGAPGPALVDRALRRTIGEGLARFEAELRAGLS